MAQELCISWDSSQDEHPCTSSAVRRASATGAKEIPTALSHLATKQEEKREEEGKETVAEVFGEEKGSGDITVSDLENWLR